MRKFVMGAGAKRKVNATNSKNASSKSPSETKKDVSPNIHTTVKPKVGVLNYFDNITRGNLGISNAAEIKKSVIMNRIKRFAIDHILNPFEKRVTSIAWHPQYSHIFVAGSKGGELTLHSMNNSDDYVFPGIGAGGSVVGLKFKIDSPCTVYTASITGKIREEDFHRENSKTLLSTVSWTNWFSCLDVDYKRNILMTGDCSGHGYLLATSGPAVWQTKVKLHKSKITHCEFNQHDQNIFVTASIDHSVKLWDLRSVSDCSGNPRPLREYHHEKSVNSAYFSASNGLSLLTTDQYDQLRVYSSPFWDETLVIKHPHRQFQHLTPIKATWHPLEDIIIVGRYPHDNFLEYDHRSIDFYDGTNGKLLHRLNSPSGQIVSLNGLNILGDTLASSAGLNVMFLKDENTLRGAICNKGSDKDSDDDDSPLKINRPKRRTMPRQRVYTKKLQQKAV